MGYPEGLLRSVGDLDDRGLCFRGNSDIIIHMTRWTLESLRQRRREIERIAEKWGARNVRVFGSVATGESGPASDVDLLVTFDEDRNLLDHGGLLMDLQEALDCRVDIVDEDAMRSRFRKRVEKEAVAL